MSPPTPPTTVITPITPITPPLRLSGRSHRGQREGGYADYTGNLRSDATHGVGQDDRRHGQAANQQGAQIYY
jgi:hypothetical protein